MSYLGNIFSVKWNTFQLDRALKAFENTNFDPGQQQKLGERIGTLRRKIQEGLDKIGNPGFLGRRLLPLSKLANYSTNKTAIVGQFTLSNGSKLAQFPKGTPQKIAKELKAMRKLTCALDSENYQNNEKQLRVHYKKIAEIRGDNHPGTHEDFKSLTDAEREYAGIDEMKGKLKTYKHMSVSQGMNNLT